MNIKVQQKNLIVYTNFRVRFLFCTVFWLVVLFLESKCIVNQAHVFFVMLAVELRALYTIFVNWIFEGRAQTVEILYPYLNTNKQMNNTQ